mgnify:CR=1 FL=1
MNTSINFPNLGIHLSNVGKSISIGGFEIAYYGMIIACGMILGLCIAMWVAKKTNQNPDQYFDVALYAIPIALIGARAYYVIFSWDQYKDNLIHILYFREGGLAIFGGVIAAVITFYVYVKIKKQNENFSIISSYETKELQELGVSEEDIKNYKKIVNYDEIVLKKQK